MLDPEQEYANQLLPHNQLHRELFELLKATNNILSLSKQLPQIQPTIVRACMKLDEARKEIEQQLVGDLA